MRKLFLIYWVFGCFFVTELSGQCLEITTKEQLTICQSEQSYLTATTNGVLLFSEWTPNKGLNNPLSLTSQITAPFDTTYTLKINGFLESTNLLSNSDFSEGYAGFTSQYEAESTKSEGYIIGKVGTELFPEAKECKDHSGPEAGGNMLMVKVSESANVEIYCQEVSVVPNRNYHFQGFATGLVINNPPVIVLKINDQPVSIGTLGSFACSWQKIKGDWNSENETTAKICLFVSPEDIGAGTHFAMDDVGFYEICEVEKEVKVDVLNFALSITEAVDLPCGDSTRLKAEVIPGDIYFLTEWASNDGNIVTGDRTLFPLVDAAGSYEIMVTTSFEDQLCQANARVEVKNISEDSLKIAIPENLNCLQNEISLNAIDFVDRANFLYQWTSTEGNIISDSAIPEIQIDKPGLYQLERTDLFGNCPQKKEVRVEETSIQEFSVELTMPNCDSPEGTILFEDIIGGTPPFAYSIDSGNNFFPDRAFPNLIGGNYDVIVEDADGCTATKNIDFAPFNSIELALPNKIRIEKEAEFQLPLQVNLVDSLIETIEWSPSFGLTCSDCLQPFFTNNQTEAYSVEVKDKNGCIAQSNIQIIVKEPSAVYIPTVFSPNQDGQNDIFQIFVNSQLVKKVLRMSIYDRYGTQVYSSADFLLNSGVGWDGHFQNRLMPTGVYLYWAEIELADGNKELFSGEIGLVR